MPKAVLEKAVNGGGRQLPLGRDGLYAGRVGHIDGMCEAFREGWAVCKQGWGKGSFPASPSASPRKAAA